MTDTPPVLRFDGGRRSEDAILPNDPSNPLTVREQEVAFLVARGYRNRQIADALVLTSGVMANHVADILNKLDCSSREEMAT